jgi:predicted MFS family arabinose efflux permease
LFLVVFAIIESPTTGWTHGVVPLAMAGGIVVLIAFALWEARVERGGGTPIVSMALFRNTSFVAGASVTGLMMLAQNGVIFSLPVFLQSVLRLDAFHTGLSLLPMSVMLLIVSPAAGFLTKHVPHKRLVQSGLIINVLALVVLYATIRANIHPTTLIGGLTLYGIGMGLVLSQVNNLTLSSVPVRDAGEASGVNNTFRQVGASLGAAIIGAILLNSIVAAVGGNAADAASLAFGDTHALALSPHLAAIRAEATTWGIRKAMLYGGVFMVFAVVASHWLPMRAAQHRTED